RFPAGELADLHNQLSSVSAVSGWLLLNAASPGSRASPRRAALADQRAIFLVHIGQLLLKIRPLRRRLRRFDRRLLRRRRKLDQLAVLVVSRSGQRSVIGFGRKENPVQRVVVGL